MHIFAAIFMQVFVNCMIMAVDNIKKMVCVCKKKDVVSQFTVKKICNLIPHRQALVIVIPYFCGLIMFENLFYIVDSV
jgi:hypothetical protein